VEEHLVELKANVLRAVVLRKLELIQNLRVHEDLGALGAEKVFKTL